MTDEGLQSVTDYVSNFKGRDVCYNCGIKLGLLGGKEIYYRFGLTQRLCKTCYKEYKQIKKKRKKS